MLPARRDILETACGQVRGDVVALLIILGHTEVSTTMKCLHLLTEDLQRPHQGLSILNRLR
jgi:hypothetical protein